MRAFIDDMPAALADAALVVARAGALTLAELAIMRRPAILIPLPTAADDHQTVNAMAFARRRRGGGAAAGDASRHARSAISSIKYSGDPARTRDMAAAMGELARPDATAEIVASWPLSRARRRNAKQRRCFASATSRSISSASAASA